MRGISMQVVVERKEGRKVVSQSVTGFRNAYGARIIAQNGGRKLSNLAVPSGGAKGGIGKGRIFHKDRIYNIK